MPNITLSLEQDFRSISDFLTEVGTQKTVEWYMQKTVLDTTVIFTIGLLYSQCHNITQYYERSLFWSLIGINLEIYSENQLQKKNRTPSNAERLTIFVP